MTSDRENSRASLDRVVAHLDDILDTASTPDYSNALNGLQLANSGNVSKVAAAVDFSSESVHAAKREGADLLLVHHGMFWPGLTAVVGRSYERLRTLLESDIAVYASHLPLDRHPQLGNNALLARALELDPEEPFARFKDIFVGWQGKTDIKTSELISRAREFSQSHGGHTVAAGARDDNRVTRRWAICTGAGASAETLAEATSNGIDTLIVGEGPHWTAVEAAERGIALIYVGHYASETLGVYALAEEITRSFGVPAVRISAPTGL